MFFCEFFEIFKNHYFEEHLWLTASSSQICTPANNTAEPAAEYAKQQQQEEEI